MEEPEALLPDELRVGAAAHRADHVLVGVCIYEPADALGVVLGVVVALDAVDATNLLLSGEADTVNTALMAGKLNHILNDNFDRGEV